MQYTFSAWLYLWVLVPNNMFIMTGSRSDGRPMGFAGGVRPGLWILDGSLPPILESRRTMANKKART